MENEHYELNIKDQDYPSEECKDLISMMLKADPRSRFKLTQILNHSWLKEEGEGAGPIEVFN